MRVSEKLLPTANCSEAFPSSVSFRANEKLSRIYWITSAAFGSNDSMV